MSIKTNTVIVMILFILTVSILAVPAKESAKAKLNSSNHDFGLIIPYYGSVKADFVLTNTGSTTLQIENLSTSCSCTTVSADKMELEPGGKANLHVIFDPLAHRGVSGQIKRIVYIETNDPASPELTIELTGYVDFGDAEENNSNKDSEKKSSVEVFHKESVIYFNEACAMCVAYLQDDLFPLIGKPEKNSVVLKDYINFQKYRKEMTELYRSLGIPPSLQSHILTNIDDKIFLGGHVNSETVNFLKDAELPMDKIYIFQDKMENPKFYSVWDFVSEPETFALNYPISTYLEEFSSRDKTMGQELDKSSMKEFITLVLTGGFIDGVNPCAFSVLIFFMIFLFSIKKRRGPVIAVGVIFIAAIFLSYLLIGLGIMQTFRLFDNNHLIARISSGLLIIMGLINIKDFFWYGRGLSLSPNWLNTTFFKKHLTRLSIFSTFIAGFMVGLCTFPCTGGIYVAILGILSTQITFTEGIGYLILYNTAFVFPLVLILMFLTNKRTLGIFSRWGSMNKKMIKLISGLFLVILGITLFLWA